MGETYTNSGTLDFAAADASSGVYDCRVSSAWVESQSWHSTDKTNEEMELLNSVVIDWERLPSIREAALSGAMGLALIRTNQSPEVTFPSWLAPMILGLVLDNKSRQSTVTGLFWFHTVFESGQ